MPRRLAIIMLLACCASAPAAAQRPEQGLRTGNAHLVTVTASPTEGLEVGIPRDSSYAKGIALDLQGKWEESYQAYSKAQTEFQTMLRERPHWTKMIRGWLLKAEFQYDQSQRLRYRSYYSWGPPSASIIFYRGEAKRNKWMGIRAFSGRADRKLQDEILDDFQRALQQSPSYEQPRIALAAFYHEIGQHAKGRAEFAKLTDTSRVWLSVELAHYYTAAGELDKALAMIERAMKYNSSNKRYVLRSNDFDRLRVDLRFVKTVGEP
jgi:tetratricopeptide (TPR) repeat protein